MVSLTQLDQLPDSNSEPFCDTFLNVPCNADSPTGCYNNELCTGRNALGERICECGAVDGRVCLEGNDCMLRESGSREPAGFDGDGVVLSESDSGSGEPTGGGLGEPTDLGGGKPDEVTNGQGQDSNGGNQDDAYSVETSAAAALFVLTG